MDRISLKRRSPFLYCFKQRHNQQKDTYITPIATQTQKDSVAQCSELDAVAERGKLFLPRSAATISLENLD